jgi:hypothetical protein
MKKLVIATIACASMVFASSAFALKAMDANSMKDTTAQAGVSISLDNIVIEQMTSNSMYIDKDGLGGNLGAGAVIITGSHTVKRIQKLGDVMDMYNTGVTYVKKPLTIDIVGDLGAAAGNKAGVVIGLPTISIETWDLGQGKDIGIKTVDGVTDYSTVSLDATDILITTYCQKKTMNILAGTLFIFPH